MDSHLVMASAGPAIDLRHLDGVLSNLRQAERALAAVAADLAEARDRIAAAPDDPEARHRVRMAFIHVRGEAVAVASHLAAVAREDTP